MSEALSALAPFAARQSGSELGHRLRRAAWTLRRSPASVVGATIVAMLALLAVFGPWVVPYPEDAAGAMHLAAKLQPPSWAHPFGTDEMGTDLLTRTIIGTRTSLLVGFVVPLGAMLIGVPLGLAAGYLGGWVRVAIMRATDMFLSVPSLMLAIAIVAALGPGLGNAILAIGLVWWPGYVRLIEAKALSLRTEPFVDAARAAGSSSLRIMLVHLLPNCMSPIIVKFSMDVGMAILSVASLGFIGLGAKPPIPEWGAMISIGRAYMPNWWWYATFPGLFIYAAVLGFNLLGDGLRDALDPRSERS